MKDLSRVKVGRVVPNWILGMWETFPDREAVVDGDKRYTFGELRRRVLKLANGIQGLGVRPKDAVAVMIYNSAEFLECLCGLSLIGATMPFVNWHLRGEELKTTINLRSPKILIFDAEFMDDIVKIKEGLETVKYFVVVGDFSSLPSGIISYEDLLATQPTTRPEVNFLAALNPYTGGTTGTPKSSNLYDSFGYMLSDLAEAPRASFESYLQYTSKAFSYFYWFGGDSIADPIEKNIRTLLVTPMYHAGTAAGWGPCFMMGATALIMRKFDPEEFLAMIDRERANWVFVAPTILQRVLALPEGVKEKYDLSAMRTIICAAAPCPPQVKKDINELFIRQGAPQPVFGEYYGSAETAIVTVLLPRDYVQDPNRINGVGKARCGDLKIYNEEESRWADTGEVGKIMCRTASTLALRYPGSEDRLHESIRIIEGEEWYDDGLLGYLDKDGFLYLTGRVKEMIISGGVNVYPMEIEEVILKHPDVFDAAVVRLPHPDLGEVPIACVQLLEGRRLSEEDLIDFCKQEGLRGYKLPARVEFLEELPRHIDGKIIKRELEARYWEGEEAKG
jgi:long-chain acyl-CoA synthetase